MGKRIVVPFRAIIVVSHSSQAARACDIARATPDLGLAMMIRDPGHDPAVVRRLCREVVQWRLPENLMPISNGVRVKGIGGIHWTSRQLLPEKLNGDTPADGQSGGIVGASVHTMAELAAAERLGADYLTVSPVYPPGSKSVESTLGPPGLAAFAEATHLPLFALGGISAENAGECISEGAWGIAAISWFQNEPIDHISGTLTRLFDV